MQLESFIAQKFRNLCDIEFSPAPGMNVIFGENAQGKTNLLEGIYIVSTVRSFRTRHLSETVQFGETGGWIQGTVQSAQSKHLLGIAVGERDRQLMLNRKKVDALQYIVVFNVFLFSYPLLEVIRGGPEERRKFLDRSISVSKTGYLPLLLQYHRAVKQKNALLQSAQKGEVSRKDAIEEILSFNEQLATHGLEIAKYRGLYVAELQELLNEKKKMFFEEDVRLNAGLRSTFLSSERDVRQNLERCLERELSYGSCLMGVHRDELLLTINDRELRRYGSSGQHRAFLLLFKSFLLLLKRRALSLSLSRRRLGEPSPLEIRPDLA